MPHAVRELGPGDELEATGIPTAEMVSRRAPGGFGRIEDVLSPAELAAFDEAYRATTLPDVATLNARPSLTP